MYKILSTVLLVGLAALASPSARASDSAFLGTLMGSALGGYVGSTIGKGDGRLAATGAGVFIGGALGHNFGRTFDRPHRSYYPPPVGYGSSGWSRPHFHSHTPNYVAPPAPQIIYVHPYPDHPRPSRRAYIEESYVGPPSGGQTRHCREFTQTVRIDGQNVESYGIACVRPDGTWQIQP